MWGRRFAIATLWCAAGLTLGGCATRRASLSDLPVRELTGHYTSGQGESWFRPCDAVPADPSWWVTLTGRAVEAFETAGSAGRLLPGETYFVRWRAAVTTGGEIGPQGKGVPALMVRELLELRPAAEGDCAHGQERDAAGH